MQHAAAGRSLGRPFGWLWAAFAASALGTWVAFDAFPLIAILALHAGPVAVSALAASGLAVGAVLALPLGPWVEGRAKRPVMIGMDLLRCAALATVPAAYALGVLSVAQLLVVAVVVGAADIAFRAASGACLKGLLAGEDLLEANGRLEGTTWTATLVGPPVGGALIGAFGPVVTVIVNAASFVLSALGIRAMGGREAPPAHAPGGRLSRGELLEGWRHIRASSVLAPLLANTAAVNALILATAPLLAVLMLGDLGFAPWQYGLAFALPCAGGLAGSRLSRPLAARHGRLRVLRAAGTLRACFSVGLAFVVPGTGGLLLVMACQLAIVTASGIFTPILATHRLDHTPPDRVARTLSAWSITSALTVAATTALWGLLAAVVGPRAAIAAAGVLLLATPLLLPRPA